MKCIVTSNTVVFSLISAFSAGFESMGWKPMRGRAKMAVLQRDFAWLNARFIAIDTKKLNSENGGRIQFAQNRKDKIRNASLEQGSTYPAAYFWNDADFRHD